MNKIATLILFTLLASVGGSDIVSLRKDFIVCRPVANAYGVIDNTVIRDADSERKLMEEAKGPKGSRGERGEDGRQGSPNYNTVHPIVDATLQVTDGRLKRLQKALNRLKLSREAVASGLGDPYVETEKNNSQQCAERFQAPISHEGQCIRVLGDRGVVYTLTTATRVCTKMGGHLADLNSPEIYDKLWDYVSRKFTHSVTAYTGMTIKNGLLLKSDNEAAAYMKMESVIDGDRNGIVATFDNNRNVKYIHVTYKDVNFALCAFNLHDDVIARAPTPESFRKLVGGQSEPESPKSPRM